MKRAVSRQLSALRFFTGSPMMIIPAQELQTGSWKLKADG